MQCKKNLTVWNNLLTILLVELLLSNKTWLVLVLVSTSLQLSCLIQRLIILFRCALTVPFQNKGLTLTDELCLRGLKADLCNRTQRKMNNQGGCSTRETPVPSRLRAFSSTCRLQTESFTCSHTNKRAKKGLDSEKHPLNGERWERETDERGKERENGVKMKTDREQLRASH